MEQLKLNLSKQYEVEITSMWFTIENTSRNFDCLFVFGDNTRRYGKGGQAQIRSEFNAVGLATKYNPGMEDKDFFNDRDIEKIKKILDQDIEKIKKRFDNGNFRKIVFPIAGLGTGLSQLPQRSPKAFNYLCKLLEENFGINTMGDGTLWKNY